MHSLVYL